MISMEDKILGIDAKDEPKAKETVNYFDVKTLWTVTKKGCGSSTLTGNMVHEMLDYASKKEVLAGKKEVKYGDITFKLKK